MDWSQCDGCGKLGSAASLNALGLCPECAANDDIVAAKEEEQMAMSERDDKAAANAARPRDYEYSDAQREADYEAHLDAIARCPECDEGYMNDSISVAGEPDRRECPLCGYWEYTDRS